MDEDKNGKMNQMTSKLSTATGVPDPDNKQYKDVASMLLDRALNGSKHATSNKFNKSSDSSKRKAIGISIGDDDDDDTSDDELRIIDPESTVEPSMRTAAEKKDGSVTVPQAIPFNPNTYKLRMQSGQPNKSSSISSSSSALHSRPVPERKVSAIGKLSTNHIIKPAVVNHINSRNNENKKVANSATTTIGTSAKGKDYKMIGSVLVDTAKLMKNSSHLSSKSSGSSSHINTNVVNGATLTQQKQHRQAETVKKTQATADDNNKALLEIAELLNRKSSHAQAAEDAMFSEFDKQCDKLIKRETKIDRTSEMKFIKITAYHCITCDLLTDQLISLCQDRKHVIKKVETVKRFFECSNCYKREFTLGNNKLPSKSCVKCGLYTWIATGSKGTAGQRSANDHAVVLGASDWTGKSDRKKIGIYTSNLDA